MQIGRQINRKIDRYIIFRQADGWWIDRRMDGQGLEIQSDKQANDDVQKLFSNNNRIIVINKE